MEETLTINKKVMEDLVRVKEEFDSIIESLKLMNDNEFMKSFEKSKKQIKKREFADWDAL